MGCFCYQLIASLDSIEKLEQLKFEGMEQNICLVWLKNYIFEQFSAPGIAGAISAINVLQLEILQRIVYFEKHHFVTG